MYLYWLLILGFRQLIPNIYKQTILSPNPVWLLPGHILSSTIIRGKDQGTWEALKFGAAGPGGSEGAPEAFASGCLCSLRFCCFKLGL